MLDLLCAQIACDHRGGIREPAAVRWKGTIPPGRISNALTATYDIFATIIALAKAPPPTGVTLDGKDLTQVLMTDAPSPHRCLMFYHSPQSNEANTSGIAAVRCGDYKAHFFTHSTACAHTQTTAACEP